MFAKPFKWARAQLCSDPIARLDSGGVSCLNVNNSLLSIAAVPLETRGVDKTSDDVGLNILVNINQLVTLANVV